MKIEICDIYNNGVIISDDDHRMVVETFDFFKTLTCMRHSNHTELYMLYSRKEKKRIAKKGKEERKKGKEGEKMRRKEKSKHGTPITHDFLLYSSSCHYHQATTSAGP